MPRSRRSSRSGARSRPTSRPRGARGDFLRPRRSGCSRACSCTAAGCTCSATCCSCGSSATTSRTASVGSGSSLFYLVGGIVAGADPGRDRSARRPSRSSARPGRSRRPSAPTSCCSRGRADPVARVPGLLLPAARGAGAHRPRLLVRAPAHRRLRGARRAGRPTAAWRSSPTSAASPSARRRRAWSCVSVRRRARRGRSEPCADGIIPPMDDGWSRWSSRASASTCSRAATSSSSRRPSASGTCPSGSGRGRRARSRCACRA